MPGMNADVFWGDPDEPPPDWREHPVPDAHEDDGDNYSEDATPERKKWVRELIGFDPHENDDDEDDDDGDETSQMHESASDASQAFGRLARKATEMWREEYP